MADHDEGAGASGGSGAGGPNRNRSRNRNRNRNRNRSGASRNSAGNGGGGSSAGNSGSRANPTAPRKKQGGGGGGNRQRAGGQGGRGSPSRAGGRSRGGTPHSSVTLAPPPPLEPPDVQPGLGAPQVFPAEVAANRHRVVALCAASAVVPALLLGALVGVLVSAVAGVAVVVVAGAAVMYGVWRLAPTVALRRIGAVPIDDHDETRLSNITEGLCATFGLSKPSLHLLEDDVPNACALGRDTRRSDLVVTRGLLRLLDPIELEGVVAHELAHVKRGDNGVSCIGITLGTVLGGASTLRRCVGENREYRADVVGASAVRFPRGLLGALRAMMEAPPPAPGSFFASPSRFGSTRWVWIDPSVGHRGEDLVAGDLDATAVRAAALSEW